MSDIFTLVINRSQLEVLDANRKPVEVLFTEKTTVIEDTRVVREVLDKTKENLILEVAKQGIPGPQGAAGEPGQAGVAFVPLKASGALGGQRVVRAAFPGYVRYADSSLAADANHVVGISLNAAVDGATVNVAASGEIVEPTWNWEPDMPVFVGLEGRLTQTPPAAGFSLVVAVATSPTSVVVGVKQPIVL